MMRHRIFNLVLLLAASWVVMTFTHEIGHVIGGTCSGGTLRAVDLLPWHLPYSIFEPDPFPLITLWSGLLSGVVVPMSLAVVVRREWMWFIAYFCLLANGAYIAAGWITSDRFLDTTQLLAHGASPITIALYSLLTLGFGYVGFRKSMINVLSA